MRTAFELAAEGLVEKVEKYLRQECLRSELIIAKDNLKRIVETRKPKRK